MNPFHFRARIDHLWRRSADHHPGYIRLKALKTITSELFAPNPQAKLNYQTYLATDPFDVARHLLRDLYDHADPTVPAQTEVAQAQAALLTEEKPPDEDDDPL